MIAASTTPTSTTPTSTTSASTSLPVIDRRAIRALRWAGAVGGLSQSLAAGAGALLVRDVTGSDAVAGSAQAALVVGAAVAAAWLSRLARTRGRRVALTAGSLTALAGAVLVALAGGTRSLPVILVGSAMLGAGGATVMLGRYAAAQLAAPGARARVMGWTLVATSVGSVVGPNLLAPSTRLAGALGLPPVAGAYVLAAAGFGVAAALLAVGLRDAFPNVTQVVRRRTSTGARPAGGTTAVAVLACANLVMVAVMTMAPVHLHHGGVGLEGIGLVVSLHIAAMFLPSPASGRASDAFGPRRVVLGGAVTLGLASLVVAAAPGSPLMVGAGLVMLGVGWNLVFVAGSAWLVHGVAAEDRPAREGRGEVGMGVAAALGGLASGLIVEVAGYAALATVGALAALLIVPIVRREAVSGSSGRRRS